MIRIIAVTILIYPATYAAKESTKHRKVANDNRRSELELAAINPFIENLSDNQKQSIKEKLVEKYFGNTTNEIDNDKGEEFSLHFVDRLMKLISTVKK